MVRVEIFKDISTYTTKNVGKFITKWYDMLPFGTIMGSSTRRKSLPNSLKY